jgi:hypothetical protein
MGKIKIVDTTLRDGEQTAGVVFANKEKLRIAKMLDAIGVDQIEAGIPVMGGHEKETIKQICKLGLRSSIMGWNRAVINDIEHSLECGVDAVAISISTSSIAALPARSPKPITVTPTHLAPARTPARALAVAIPKSLWVCISTSIPTRETSSLIRSYVVKGSKIPTVSQ